MSHLQKCTQRAIEAIAQSRRQLDEQLAREKAERNKTLELGTFYLSKNVRKRMRDNGQSHLSHVDPSLLAAHAIPTIPTTTDRTKPRSSSGSRPKTGRGGGTLLPTVDPVPRYDAWIPVSVNYWAGKELNVEPYMPFLGDQDNECEAAFEVYEDMAGDAGKDLDVSDGELNDAGTFTPPRGDFERIRYYSMQQTRWREAIRDAILVVLQQFSRRDDAMWRILSQSLGLKNIARVKAIARIAGRRARELQELEGNRRYARIVSKQLAEVERNPYDDELPSDEGEERAATANVLKHFCFTCHTFACLQHAGTNVAPVVPIEDPEVTRREREIETNTAVPCSTECGLLPERKKNCDTSEPWSGSEILILREAVPIFGKVPCTLAVMVGSRSCAQVAVKLDDPIESEIADEEIRKARRPRRIASRSTANEDDRKDKPKKLNKTFVETDYVSTDQDFEPCEHKGPCVAEVCPCIRKGMYCETTCGCNTGRYGEGGPGEGIVWLAPSRSGQDSARPSICSNRHLGCSCTDGNCANSKCPCWEQYRACSPDFCGCDVTLLPNRYRMHERQCSNGPVTVGQHKRTIIGHSDVHGFGLFAAERFYKGDMVGTYSGQLIDTRLADMLGRIYDATNRTYIFNVTESLVIDGGLLGSKAKFINHTRPGGAENCGSRLVRVRGDAHVALFATRTVEAGDEFLFDYRFTGEVPEWARNERATKAKK